MNKTLISIAALGITLAAVSPVTAQGPARRSNDCVSTLIQARLLAQQPLRLSAEKVSLSGDTLRLTGRASVRFDDTTVQAEEIVIDQSTKRVEFTAVRRILLGSASPCAPPSSSLPRIEYR